MQSDTFRKEFVKVLLFALLSLFAIPGIALLFVEHAESGRNAEYVGILAGQVDGDARLSEADKLKAKEFLNSHPPSVACSDDSAEVARYRATVCPRYSELWQYDLVRVVAGWALVGGLVVLLAILALGGIAFVNRSLQHASFMVGWNLLRFAAAAGVVVQGALFVWLSFWVTAYFFESYFLKLIVIAAVLAGGAVLYAIIGIFKRPPEDSGIDGELVSETDAPALWEHVRKCAAHFGTAPLDHIVAGIDANFFVTQSPLKVGGRTLTGRSLFVSLPLLRILERTEADAVLGHELAHFRGGDTAMSASIGPKLVQYDHYCQLMYTGGSTRAVFHLIYLYRFIFELALRRDSRAREFQADRVAARLISAQSIVHSLVKVSAYSGYRNEIERKLFEHDAIHEGALGIAGQVAQGLVPYATSAHFTDAMKTANVPHPFDSHPALPERMQNVGHHVEEQRYGAIVTSVPTTTWVTDIGTADAIEQRLWAVYERRFAEAHEQSLAWRYLPSNDAERAIVLKYFPPIAFELKREQTLEITYEGLRPPGEVHLVSWDDVADLEYTDGMGGDVLQIVHSEKSLLGKKKTKMKLPGASKQRGQIKEALGNYWQRHRVMRQQQAGR